MTKNVSNSESSALNATRSFGSRKGFSNALGTYLEKKEAAKKAKTGLKCTHCNQKGHTVDQCFKIHGFPKWFKKLKASKGNSKMAAVVTEMVDNPLMYQDNVNQNSNDGVDSTLVNVVRHKMMNPMKGKMPMKLLGMVFPMINIKGVRENNKS